MSYADVIQIVLWCFAVIVDAIYLPFRIIRLFHKPRKCPPVTDKLLFLTAVQVAEKIRKQEISSVQIVQAYITRIKEVNSLVNAVIETRFDEALLEAQRADDFIKNSDLDEAQIQEKFPLMGVPITIKGSIAVAGLNHGAGRVDHQIKAKNDAVAVKYVRDAGAIPLVNTNVPELCLNWDTVNKFIGATANPYDLSRSPGGSSGGEASLLGCGASLIGIGSDIAGSLRLPTHCCGVWGHKPTSHVVSTEGHYPDGYNKKNWVKVFTMGPMARYGSDLKPLLNIIAEPEAKHLLKLDEQIDVRKIKVYYLDDPRCFIAHRFDKTVIKAVEKAVAHLDTVSASKCQKVKIPLMKHCMELSYISLLNVGKVDSVLDGKKDVLNQLFKFHTGQSDYQFTSVYFEIIRRNIKIFSPFMDQITAALKELHNHFLEMLGDDGVFILPTSFGEADFQGEIYRRVFDFGQLSIFNSLGFPATNCPIMLSPNGLPIGIQVVAAPYQDRLTLTVAEELEKAFGGWRFN